MATPRPASELERVEALFTEDGLYTAAEAAIPKTDPTLGGRPRAYPDFMYLGFACLTTIYRSARSVETALAGPHLWERIRTIVAARFPERPDLQLPAKPMTRYTFGKFKKRHLEHVTDALRTALRHTAVAQAQDMGLMDPGGPGSLTRPDPSRLVYGDGKVITPLYRAKKGDVRKDKTKGTEIPLRYDPDSADHRIGGGQLVRGVKFAFMAARTPRAHGRIVFDVSHVPNRRGTQTDEASISENMLNELLPHLPGAQGIVYDGAFRGIHIDRLQRKFGIPVINKVASAASRGDTTKKKQGFLGVVAFKRDGQDCCSATLYFQAGAVMEGALTESGDLALKPLKRVQIRRRGRPGKYRTYVEVEVPCQHEGASPHLHLERAFSDNEDKAKGFNRAENVRLLPQSDAAFQTLYDRRNDAESVNRAIDDSLYLRRAHSVGHRGQLVDLIAFAIVTNSLSRYRSRHHDHTVMAA